MSDSHDAGHPGLGAPTDIDARDLQPDPPAAAPVPASSDPAQQDDEGLGLGDGPDLAAPDDGSAG